MLPDHLIGDTADATPRHVRRRGLQVGVERADFADRIRCGKDEIIDAAWDAEERAIHHQSAQAWHAGVRVPNGRSIARALCLSEALLPLRFAALRSN